MSQSRKQLSQIAVGVLIIALATFSLFLFVKAVSHGRIVDIPAGQDTRIHVLVCQNDSIVGKLKEDVEYLSYLIKKIQADSVTIEIGKTKVYE